MNKVSHHLADLRAAIEYGERRSGTIYGHELHSAEGTGEKTLRISTSNIGTARRGPGRPPNTKVADKRSSKAIDQLVTAALNVEALPAKAAGALGFMCSVWVGATLPHAELFNKELLNSLIELEMRRGRSLIEAKALAKPRARITQFQRTNGLTELKIISDQDYGLPYGKVPRLIMGWLCTEAKRTRSRHLILGRNQAEFMRKLGMEPRGGERGTITALKDQSRRLFRSMISVQCTSNKQYGFKNVPIAEEGLILWNSSGVDTPSRWDSILTLSPQFQRVIEESSFPFDLRVINALRSPLGIDIYLWLTWRLRDVRRGKMCVPWQALRMQFGCGYAPSDIGLHHFRQAFVKQLRDVVSFYPAARVQPTTTGLLLFQSPPHIPAISAS